MIETGIREGATLALDGRDIAVPGCENGYFIGPTVFTDVKPGMDIHTTEIFGPRVVILKADSLDGAIKIINDLEYGNGASIYTQNGYYAGKPKQIRKKNLKSVSDFWYCIYNKLSRVVG